MLEIVASLFAVCAFLVHGVSDTDTVTVNQGNSLTLHTGVKINPQDGIKWYFKDILIAHMYGNRRFICDYNDCKVIFMERLKLDGNTSNLTITNVRASDAGVYKLIINRDRKKSFDVVVYSASKRDEVKSLSVQEAESVTLDPGPVGKNANNLMELYFNEIHIAEVSEDLRYICPDVQCDERFRDRLELDKHTGSLTITDARTTDSGKYTLLIIARTHSFSITTEKRFSVDVARSGSSLPTERGIYISGFVPVVLGILFFAVCCIWKKFGKRWRTHKTLDKVAEEHEPLTTPSEVKVIDDSFHEESSNSQQQNAFDQNLSNSVLQQTHPNIPAPGGHCHPRHWAQTTEDIPVTRGYVPQPRTRSLDPKTLSKCL